MPFLKIFIRWWWTFTKYNRKHFPILENGGHLKCVLTSSASFIWSLQLYKKHMATAALYLDKEQFLCSIKKKSERCFQSLEIMGVQWRAVGTICLPLPLFRGQRAKRFPLLSPAPSLQRRQGGCCLGRVCFTPTTACRVYTWNPRGSGTDVKHSSI